MADFSLTTLFVAPVGQTAVPSAGSTQDLTAGQVGVFLNDYTFGTAANIAAAPYFYVAQGRENTYLQGSKRSDKISGSLNSGNSNIIDWRKVQGNPIANPQIVKVNGFTVKPEEDISLTIRAHSAHLDTLYYNGWTKSVTIPGSCLTCGGDPCVEVSPETVVDALLAKLAEGAPGIGPDNTGFNTYFTFTKDGTTGIDIEGKPLDKYGNPCDVSAYPHEYDRMWFDVFVYKGADTTADFLASDACDSVAVVATTQDATYPSGTSEEIEQLEKNLHSYQAGYLKHLHKMVGYNQNFESHVTAGTNYSTYYIKFGELAANDRNWGAYVNIDSTIIIAVEAGSAFETDLEAILVAALGAVSADNTLTT